MSRQPERQPDAGNQADVRPKGEGRFLLSRFAYISQFTGEVVVLLLAGLWADSRWGWSPWGTVTGGALGLAVGLYHLIRNVLRRE